MSVLRSPYPYFGGKRPVVGVIWRGLGPDVPNVVDVAFGSNSLLLGRPGGAGKIETINDADRMVSNFWRSVSADPWTTAEWCDRPVNESDLHAVHKWLVEQLQPGAEFRERMHADPDYYDTKIAGLWVFGICAWIGGGWCTEPQNHKHPKLESNSNPPSSEASREAQIPRQREAVRGLRPTVPEAGQHEAPGVAISAGLLARGSPKEDRHSMTALMLAKGLSLPLQAVTETFAVLGRRGSGKTHTASVLAEELLSQSLQVVVLDPLDVWHGLRSSKDGTKAGYPIVVFGGPRGDADGMPLRADAGTLLADVIVEAGLSAVLSLRHLSKGEARRFVGEFAERLYERKGEARHRNPLHLVVDEADAFVPQRILPGGERAYGAIDTLVRRGRSSGVGTTLISQRAAVIAKDVLTQTEVLVCHQTTGPQDRKALEGWIEANDDQGRRSEFMGSLASLKRGEAWFWSPSWLSIFQRVQVRPRTTFDSSSTPEVGEKRVEPTKVASVDLDALRKRLAVTVEKAKADDPVELRKRIAELEKQLKGKGGKIEPERVEVPVFDEAAVRQLHVDIFERIDGIARELGLAKEYIGRKIVAYRDAAAAGDAGTGKPAAALGPTTLDRIPSPNPYLPRAGAPRAVVDRDVKPGNGESGLGKCARSLLTALAQHGDLSLVQAAIIAGYASDSGGVRNAAGELRAAGFVEGSNAKMAITAAGRAEVSDAPKLPTGKKLAEYWFGKLERAERMILGEVVAVYPKAISLKDAATRAGYEPSSGGVRNAAGKLRTLALVHGGNAGMTADRRLV